MIWYRHVYEMQLGMTLGECGISSEYLDSLLSTALN